MGILDEAIRQHLDLKRQHGAAESELRKLEDEAFGPPSRPGEPGGEPTVTEAGVALGEPPAPEPPAMEHPTVQIPAEAAPAEPAEPPSPAAEAPAEAPPEIEEPPPEPEPPVEEPP